MKPRWRGLMLFQIALITIIQVSNQYIIIPNYNHIKKDLGVSDFFLGSMTGLYIFLSGFSAVIWSYISDASGMRRKWLIFLSMLMSGLMTYFISFINEPALFFVGRVLTGVFLGAVAPLSFSMIADFYESNKRTKAYMFWYIISGMGMAIGFVMSVILGAYIGWRYPIYINSMMLLIIGTPLVILLIEPSRGFSDVLIVTNGQIIEYNWRFRVSDVKLILSNKSNIYVAFEEFMSTIPQGVLMAWLTQYVVREMHATEIVATIFLGLGILGGLLGTIIAHLADVLFEKNPAYRPAIAVLSTFLQTIFILIFLLLPINLGITDPDPIVAAQKFLETITRNILVPIAIITFFFGMMFNSSIEPIKNTVLSDVNLPEQRAIVASSIATIELFFRSAGIAIAGLISDITGSIRITLIAFVLLYIVASFLWLKVVKHYPQDIGVTKTRLRDRLNNINEKNNNCLLG